ncbi:vitamin B12 ABC transporter ATP-binding protein BtuD [Vibrio europaeus]|uniref:Vitamin B12 import ATP-binding protein BtuD n=1 Tax=Vibrio europaeus TaxID=300876 RepID=A0AAE7DW42_9VIBR|nr:vitamin B12 ABC transporter ATP-binding protein BtuD [Vibrio europaeus]MDC5806579.1 vitamin B12 ABC transporter ATP-binding protein BtuD [Vibrio europaeus]MDC5824194.1 vitamin B12 ABC transporter ATP-binding protein BtuD [Vibrio europaeus]MDC5829949.1 vitamin B12 ABC transporter ATP-binding protein BtuD [Vibrio europaeus]MDC5836804.1 vitamin B12 ABC transporter ATP-binding protein BtuD [Vibrio europaeus]MDC5851560.1 vitamin B12 ABC transporter ATP-binding protein BtuD [Vibrio europaeus]
MIHVNSLSVGSRLLPLSFEVMPGEILHVIGPNGSGKSTLLSAVAGLLDFEGEAKIFDQKVKGASIEALSSTRAFLAQSDRPAFNLDVVHYLSLSLPAPVSSDSPQLTAVIEELATLLEIDDKLNRSIHHLSGGEWQRVRLCAICLQIWPTLNPHAKLLILDEPAAPLDIGQETLLYKLIQRVAEMGITVLMSNHDLNRTLKYADKALLLEKGVLQNVGAVDEVLSVTELSRVFRTEVKRVVVEGSPVLLFD